jgi:hypothetical protein
MKVTTKETQVRFANVDSYRLCQGSKNYGSNNESNDEKYSRATRKQRLHDNINKNEKNEKNKINNNSRKINFPRSKIGTVNNFDAYIIPKKT